MTLLVVVAIGLYITWPVSPVVTEYQEVEYEPKETILGEGKYSFTRYYDKHRSNCVGRAQQQWLVLGSNGALYPLGEPRIFSEPLESGRNPPRSYSNFTIPAVISDLLPDGVSAIEKWQKFWYIHECPNGDSIISPVTTLVFRIK